MSIVKLRQEVVNIWIFVFPAKEDSTDWQIVQIALTISLFFSAAPKLLVDFSQCAKIQIVFTPAGVWHCSYTAFLHPWDFNVVGIICPLVLMNSVNWSAQNWWGNSSTLSAPWVFTALLNRDPYLKISSDVPGLAGAIC